MRTCSSCGGIIGRDCFNPIECAWITQSMNEQDAVDSYIKKQNDDHYKQMEIDHNNEIERDYYEYLDNEQMKVFATIDRMTDRFLKTI